MNKRRIEALKIKANEDIHRILEILKIECSERYQYLNGPCVIHGGNNPTAWSWHVDRGIWQCFTQHCDKEYGSDIYGLIRGVKRCSFIEATSFLDGIYKNEDLSIKVNDSSIANRKFVSKIKNSAKEPVFFPEDSLKKLLYHEYLEGRGYPRELIESYHIGITPDKYKEMSNRVIFPIRDIKGNIVGFSGRTLFKDYKPKWYHCKGFEKSHHLFNIDRAAKHIEETGEAIITEGPLDVLRLEQIGVHNSVAIMGVKLSQKQIALLIESGCDTIKVALDSDKAGINGTNNIRQVADSFFTIEVISLPDGKDVGDLTPEEAKGIFLNECSV